MKIRTLLRILAIAGLAISGYLLVLKLTGKIDYLAGCGEGSGCANVLGSRWSQFFGIPVTGLASGMYLVLLGSTWKPSRVVYGALAVCFAGAALWFYGILLFELKDFCPWCAGAHFVGLLSALMLWQYLKKNSKLPGQAAPGICLGFLAMGVLVLGQVYGPVPDTHLKSKETLGPDEEEVVVTEDVMDRPVHSRGEGRLVDVLGDGKMFNTSSLPHVGPADAPHVMVKYFDFTCRSCGDMHKDLSLVMKKHPGKICVIVLPVPLNRACNAHLPARVPDHAHACELARLALAGFRAKPEAYEAVHEVLFIKPPMAPELAELAVGDIVGNEALDEALEDPWIDELLAANVEDFKQLTSKTVKMPKLLIGEEQVLHGLTRTSEILLQNLEKEFGLVK